MTQHLSALRANLRAARREAPQARDGRLAAVTATPPFPGASCTAPTGAF